MMSAQAALESTHGSLERDLGQGNDAGPAPAEVELVQVDGRVVDDIDLGQSKAQQALLDRGRYQEGHGGRGALCGGAGGGGERGSSSCGMSWTTCSGHALGAGEWGRRSNEEAGPGLKCAEPGRSWRRAAAGLLRVCSAGEPAKRCSTRLERVTGTRAAVSRPAISAIKMPDDAACAAPAHGDLIPRARAFPRSRTRPRAPFPLSQLLKSSDRPAFRQPTPHPRSLQPLSAWPQVHPQRATRGRVSSQLWTAHPCRTTMLPGCSS